MTDNDETGSVLRAQWLGALDEIGDLELQRRMWLDPANKNPHWSYVEFVCCYPNADQITSAQKKGWLSLGEAQILSEFGRILLAHKSPTGNDYDNEAVLSDPAWHEVAHAAQAARHRIATLQRS